MGLINYTNIPADATATANLWNDRFGQIVSEINGNLDASNLKDQSVTLAKVATDVYTRLYPIGSVYINATDNTNPGVLLGFGTWQAFGAGRVPVGVSTSGTFASAGAVVGTETNTMTYDQMPSHNHGVNDPGHRHSSADGQQVAIATSSTNRLTQTGSSQPITWGNTQTSNNGSNISIQNAGNNQPQNNIQPSIVVYMWLRVG